MYVAPGSRFEKNASRGQRTGYHLVLLCKNMTGYRNLMYLVSRGFTEGFYNKPRIDLELLASHTEGLIGLSACLAGQISQNLIAGNYDEAKRAAQKYAAMFDKGDFISRSKTTGLPINVRSCRALSVLPRSAVWGLSPPTIATICAVRMPSIRRF